MQTTDPIRSVAQWLADSKEAAGALLEHASSAGSWGYVAAGLVVLGGLKLITKVIRRIPFPIPYVSQAAALLDLCLPGNHNPQLAAEVQRQERIAAAGLHTGQQALEMLQQFAPDHAAAVIRDAKAIQDKLGVRKEVEGALAAIETLIPPPDLRHVESILPDVGGAR